MRLLFVCAGHAAMSQVAAAFARHHGQDRVEAESAGLEPSGPHPVAARVMAERGLDLGPQPVRRMTDEQARAADCVITLGSGVPDRCPSLPAHVRHVHWPIAVPGPLGRGEAEPVQAFRDVRDQIEAHVRELLTSLLDPTGAPPEASRDAVGTILVVDDEASARLTVSLLLREEGFAVTVAGGVAEACHALEHGLYDIVLTDLRMEDGGGVDLVQAVRRLSPSTEVIVLTAYGSIGSAVEVVKLGAFDYLTKPFEPEELVLAVRKALERRALLREVEFLRAQVRDRFGLERIVTKGAKMRALLDLVCRIAPSDATVLIQGESGTGKELIARATHARSRRADRAFVAVDCASLPEPLLESELFGHAKGAFTGAITAKKGLFEEANRGTIFLDEIGVMPLSTQVKLLRVLQEQTIRRVGSTTSITVDVRVLAATNQDLKTLVDKGLFREDLYYRLNGIVLTAPSLRERSEDIIPLAGHFLKLFADKLGRASPILSAGAVDRLLRYAWPGNVRELEKAIERAVVLAQSDTIVAEDLPPAVAGGPGEEPPSGPRRRTLEEVEKAHILSTLYESGWNQAKTAETLGISRTTLWRKLREYGIKAP